MFALCTICHSLLTDGTPLWPPACLVGSYWPPVSFCYLLMCYVRFYWLLSCLFLFFTPGSLQVLMRHLSSCLFLLHVTLSAICPSRIFNNTSVWICNLLYGLALCLAGYNSPLRLLWCSALIPKIEVCFTARRWLMLSLPLLCWATVVSRVSD